MPRGKKGTKKSARGRGGGGHRRVSRKSAVPTRCFFCEKRSEPSALESEVLFPFLTRRGKIRGQRRSGLCARHQRRLAKEIKRARNLGLLPFKIEG